MHRDVTARLRAAGCVAAEEEAAVLLAAGPTADRLEAWLRRREDGEPLEWIVGTARFGGMDVAVTPGVYVPRPQSEELAARAAAVLPAGGTLLDLGTGSGALAVVVAARVPSATVVGIDLSSAAAGCARTNGVAAVIADLGTAPIRGGAVDVVVSVAPYVPTGAMALLPADVRRHEPRVALDGGADGLDLVRAVVRTARRVLRPGGSLLVELGDDQDAHLADDLDAAGFTGTATWHDDEGDLRGLAASRSHTVKSNDNVVVRRELC